MHMRAPPIAGARGAGAAFASPTGSCAASTNREKEEGKKRRKAKFGSAKIGQIRVARVATQFSAFIHLISDSIGDVMKDWSIVKVMKEGKGGEVGVRSSQMDVPSIWTSTSSKSFSLFSLVGT